MNKILVIEDEVNIARVIEYDLKISNYNVDVVHDGKLSLDYINNNDYDVIIIDWMLPNMSGIEIVKYIKSNNINSILIMLTAKDEEFDILQAFDAGVDDYIKKPFSPRELVARIKAHLNRNITPTNDNSNEIVIKDIKLDLNKRNLYINDKEVKTTKTEFDLLNYLISNKDIVLSRDILLNNIWNFDYDGDSRIVDVHISKLRHKLSDTCINIKSSRGLGYILEINNE